MNEVLNDIFRNIEKETGSTQIADYSRAMSQKFLNRPVLNSPKGIDLPTRDVSQALSSLEAATHLSLAVVSHANKPMNIMFMHGIGPLCKAFLHTASEFGEMEETAVKAGSLMTRVMPELKRQFGSDQPLMQKIGASVLSPLTKLDRTFRIIASEAGRLAGKEYAEGLLKDPADRYFQEKLLQLGINPGDVVRAKGFTRDMELQAAKRTSDFTQFRNDVSSLPLWWRSSQWGRLSTMFKSFYYQQSKFFKDVVVMPALRYHDFRPLAYLALVAPFAAEPFADLRTLVRGQYQHRPGFSHPIDRAVDNMVQAGVLGMLYEVPIGLASPHDSFMRRMLADNFGPIPVPAEQFIEAYNTAGDILQSRDPGKLLKEHIEKVGV